MPTSVHHDPDFSRAVLRDLYSYPRKKRWVAWALWLTLGWAGAHRFYLGKEITGALMLFTGGGGGFWWAFDVLRVDKYLTRCNVDQELREREGRPPRGLDGMPPLSGFDPERPPDWVEIWRKRSSFRRSLRFWGDMFVLFLAPLVLGALMGNAQGAVEAAVAILVLAGLTALGSGPAWLEDMPVGRDLLRWSHRLRLFYRHNPPSSPAVLVVRPIVGLLWAPFRVRDRAEVRIYGELGAVFTAGFLLMEVIPGLVIPAVTPGQSANLSGFLTGWVGQAFSTFFIVYAFAAPVGAILNRYLLLEDTHRLPRILAVMTLIFVALGFLAGL